MHLLPIFAAATGGSGFDDMLRLFGVAAIVYAFFHGIKSLMQKPASTPVAAPAPIAQPQAVAATRPEPVAAPQPEPAAPSPDQGIPPEIVAVIAAAVAAVAGQAHRIVSINPMSTSWERAGRQSVLTSHRIR